MENLYPKICSFFHQERLITIYIDDLQLLGVKCKLFRKPATQNQTWVFLCADSEMCLSFIRKKKPLKRQRFEVPTHCQMGSFLLYFLVSASSGSWGGYLHALSSLLTMLTHWSSVLLWFSVSIWQLDLWDIHLDFVYYWSNSAFRLCNL